jgi:plasmid stabilization system protein ParE
VLDIWERIATENPKAADKLIRKFDTAMRGLSKQPEIGSP